MHFNCLLRNCPFICPAQRCMEPFNLKHIDSCPYGGVVIRRHEYIKNIFSKHAEKSFGTACVSVEPGLGELNEEEIQLISGNITKEARADIIIMDYDGTQTSSYFDVSVISAICDTHIENDVLQTLKLGEKRKNAKYGARIKIQFGSNFYPLLLSSGGAMGPMALKAIKQISRKRAKFSMENASEIASEMKNDISMSLIKSRIQGLRCNRNPLATQIHNIRNSYN